MKGAYSLNSVKLPHWLTLLTAVLTVIVYVDTMFFYGVFFITIPAACLSAIIALIIATVKKETLLALLNLALGAIAVLSFVVFPW